MTPIEVIFLLSLPGFFISLWAGMVCYSSQPTTDDDAKLLSRLLIFIGVLWGMVLALALHGAGMAIGA